MVIELYLLLWLLAGGMIVLGLVWSSHSEFAIVGFVFAFLLGLMLMNGSVNYRVGTNTTSDIFYTAGDATQVNQTFTYSYTPFNDTDSQLFGKYSAIASALGFVVMLFMLTRSF